jgi:hypothetical protein
MMFEFVGMLALLCCVADRRLFVRALEPSGLANAVQPDGAVRQGHLIDLSIAIAMQAATEARQQVEAVRLIQGGALVSPIALPKRDIRRPPG